MRPRRVTAAYSDYWPQPLVSDHREGNYSDHPDCPLYRAERRLREDVEANGVPF
jgi:hypothetical protein